MDENDVAMLVITEADYANTYGYEPGTTNARTEIIVRQAQHGWQVRGEDELPARSCLTDDAMGFRFRTGLGGGRECHCEPGSHLNCEGG